MGCDGLGDAAGGDREEIGRAADRDAVIVDRQRLRAGGTDQFEGGLDLVVAAKIPLPADDRRAFQEMLFPKSKGFSSGSVSTGAAAAALARASTASLVVRGWVNRAFTPRRALSMFWA